MDVHLAIVVGIAFSVPFMAMLAGHWFPWRKLKGSDLTRIQAYSYGTAWIVGFPVIIYVIWQQWDTIAVLVAATAGAGLATLLAYAADAWMEQRHRLLDEQDKAAYATTRGHESVDLAD